MSADKPYKKEKNQNIQVVVRLRPVSKREGEIRSNTVVEVSNSREVVVKPTIGFSKKFTFDRAFGPLSTQVEVYHEVVSPLISEVLNGYNCTVFAYGQTGTGKTHTMVGENTGADMSWQNDPLAGIIPRALSQIFDELRIINSEYTIRVSYLELYNEELFDLLSTSDDNSKLRIYEDSTRKGSNIVNGLEEVTVYSKSEVYKIMEKGQERRRIASTLMNAQSSRSHTIFTIVVHMKENSSEGEELMKIGKLNLVDLAGSENISKAGTDNPQKKERARECVNINQSLLTLGRVITSLVERHPHVPYRESKLTRLLQESLGGRTKTSIIATIAPGHKDMEETLSTLEYAHRAKNIQNKPEVNQKMTKKAVLKEYSEEIDRLKRDIQAARDKTGVYLATESYNEMILIKEDQEKEIHNKILEIKALMEEKDRITAIFNELSCKLKEKEAIIESTAQDLSSTKQALDSTKEVLSQTEIHYREQSHLVEKHVETESTFSNQARNVLNATEELSSDNKLLHDSMDKRRTVEEDNLLLTKYFGDKSRAHRLQMKESLETFADGFRGDLHHMGKMVDEQYVQYVKRETSTKTVAESLVANLKQGMEELREIQQLNKEKTSIFISEEQERFQRNIEKCAGDFEATMSRVLGSITQLAEWGNQDKEWLGNVKKFIVDRQNVHQDSHSTLQDNFSNFFSENQMQFDKLTEKYRADMNEQTEIMEKLRNRTEVQQKEIDNSTSTLDSILNNVLQLKNEQESVRLRNEEMFNSIKENAQLAQQREKDFDTLITAECGETKNRYTTFLTGVDETMNSNGRFMSELVGKFENQSTNLERETSCREEIMNEVQSATVIQKENTSKCLAHVESTISKIINNQTDATDISEKKLQTFTRTCGSTIGEMITSADSLVTDMTNDEKLLQDTLCQNEETLKEFKEQVHESLIEWDNMESEYMGKQYKVYAPTGKTPIRKLYHYPKTFAATSPHERILKRFRSSRTTSQNDSTTIDLTESNMGESPPKEAKLRSFSSVSSLSDDSCVFIEPAAKTTRQIEKSTSEGDIHKLTSSGKKVSKENLSQSDSDNKSFRSKLRQPSKKNVLTNKNNN